jgi:serine/threonine protein kinase
MTAGQPARAILLYGDLRRLPPREWKAELDRRAPGLAELHDVVLKMLEEELTAAGPPLREDVAPRSAATSTALTDLPPEYRILRELGRGGMGVVYLAEHRAHRGSEQGRHVAVKVLQRSILTRHGAEAIRRELETLLRLDQVGTIPRVIDFRIDDVEGGYIASEYVDGWSLEHFVRDASAPLGDRLRLFADIVDTIARVHAHGIVHRDIKPNNILVRRHRGPNGWSHVVIDFGLSLDRMHNPFATPPPAGTLAFMSPEHRKEPDRIGVRSDIYSLGTTLLWLLHERVPETFGTLPSFPSAVQDLLGQHGCRTIHGVISRCLMHNPIDRFQSANELLESLGEVPASLARGPVKSRGPTAQRRSLDLDVLGIDRSTREVFRVDDCVVLLLVANHAAVAAIAMRTPSGEWLRICPDPNDEPLALSRGVRTEYPGRAQRFVINLAMGPGEYTFVAATFARPDHALEAVRDPAFLETLEATSSRRKDAASQTILATATCSVRVVASADRSSTE